MAFELNKSVKKIFRNKKPQMWSLIILSVWEIDYAIVAIETQLSKSSLVKDSNPVKTQKKKKNQATT